MEQISYFADSEAVEGTTEVHRRKRKRRIPWLILIPFFSLVAGWAFYVFAMPSIESYARSTSSSRMVRTQLELSSPQRELFRTCQYLAVCWFFYFGASIGSFFNLLAGRLPAGRGVVFGGSMCPYCATKLSKIANLPLFGWLWCRGQCLTCRLPIASRYLWMEILFGLLFVSLAARELFSGGANLPNWRDFSHPGIINTVFYPKWNLIAIYLHHVFYLATLMMLAASSMERNPFPWRAWMLIVLLIVVVRLQGSPFEFIRWSEWIPIANAIPQWLSSGITVVLGVVAGTLFGLVSMYFLPRFQLSGLSDGIPHLQELPLSGTTTRWVQGSLLVGGVVGWQSAAIVVVAAVLLAWCMRFALGRKTGYAPVVSLAALFAAAFLHMMAWRQIASMIWLSS